jgi:xanthine dehydrogenase molybdopterin-binding subunit B
MAEGEIRIGGQEHFYLETNVALVKLDKFTFDQFIRIFSLKQMI